MPSSITRFAIRSSGRDLALVRRPQRPAPEPVAEPPFVTKAELMAQAEARGFDTSGNKADILARLEASDD